MTLPYGSVLGKLSVENLIEYIPIELVNGSCSTPNGQKFRALVKLSSQKSSFHEGGKVTDWHGRDSVSFPTQMRRRIQSPESGETVVVCWARAFPQSVTIEMLESRQRDVSR